MAVATDWELTIIDAMAGRDGDMVCLGACDLDGDGVDEIIVGATNGLKWYKKDGSGEGMIVPDFAPHCGCAFKDVDGCGIPEIFVGTGAEPHKVFMLKAEDGLNAPWTMHTVDDDFPGGAHDILFADIDGDGKEELVVVAMYTPTPGIYVFRPGADSTAAWDRFEVQAGISGDGLIAGKVDDSGTHAILQGPFLWRAPAAGPYSGPWSMEAVAPGFREMGRTRMEDVTGNGYDDCIICEAEYPDGRLSWFENKGDGTWDEHRMDMGLNFCHTLQSWRTGDGAVHVLAAEMAKGGWDAPYNWDARTIHYVTHDHGATWERNVIIRGQGNHDGIVSAYDADGPTEIIGKEVWNPRVMMWRKGNSLDALKGFKHQFIDRTKKGKAVDILPVTVAGRTAQDVICGRRHYDAGHGWAASDIPGVEQVLARYDVDGCGSEELICMAVHPDQSLDPYSRLTSELCWVKAVDPAAGKWETHRIGTGNGDWPHGAVVAPLLPGGRPALVTSYHSCTDEKDFPEIWEIPEDPSTEWPQRVIAEIEYKEELLVHDLDGNGVLDVIAGNYLLQNNGDGTFATHKVADIPVAARTRMLDVNGNGRADLVFVEEEVDYVNKIASFARIGWLENPGDPWDGEWKLHVVDTLRSPHSLDVCDIDGDGEVELIVGEHDPFKGQRSRSRLAVYKKADASGNTWKRFIMDDRFEHHCGTKAVVLEDGSSGIVSHGWTDSMWVHLWRAE